MRGGGIWRWLSQRYRESKPESNKQAYLGADGLDSSYHGNAIAASMAGVLRRLPKIGGV